MDEQTEYSLKRLWLAYKTYHLASCRNGSDPAEYATACTNNFLEYYYKMTNEGETPFKWNLIDALENQVRILLGFIECYEKVVVKDKKTAKTRWCV